jgi:AcrR family transcriptional regulator
MTEKELSTEEKILISASKVFTEKGFSGTRTRDIAEEAGINLRFSIIILEAKKNF